MGLGDKLRDLGYVPRKGSAADQVRQKQGVGRSAEWMRIAGLPYRKLDLSAVPDLTPVFQTGLVCPGCDLCANGEPKLRPIQSACMLNAEAAGGLLAPITVGGGKELACLLLPEAVDAKRAVILTKPRLKARTLSHDMPRYGRHFRIPRERIVGVVSYTELSSAGRGDILDRLRPDFIITNEAHCLKNRASARTRKFLRYFKENPETRLAALSGTMTTRTLRDYWHLAWLALRRGCPMPSSWREVDDWCRALDAAAARDPDSLPIHPGAILDLCGPEARAEETAALEDADKLELVFGKNKESEDVERRIARLVYARRLTGTVGVVATSGAECDASIVITARMLAVPPDVKEIAERVRTTWRIEDENLDEPPAVAAVLRQLACGFYYKWDWPGGEKDLEWLQARSDWHKAVAEVLHLGRKGLDSTLQVQRAVERGQLPKITWAWEAWDAVRDRPKPPTIPVWLSDFLVDDAAGWAESCTKKERGLLWYDHTAVEHKLAERGLRCYGAGSSVAALETDDTPCVAVSVHAHRDGANLQTRCRALFITPFANGTGFEQAIGREHRSGQLADEIAVEIYQHEESLRSAFKQAMQDAHYQKETLTQDQRLLLATLIGFQA